jgi:hypothetical protein
LGPSNGTPEPPKAYAQGQFGYPPQAGIKGTKVPTHRLGRNIKKRVTNRAHFYKVLLVRAQHLANPANAVSYNARPVSFDKRSKIQQYTPMKLLRERRQHQREKHHQALAQSHYSRSN